MIRIPRYNEWYFEYSNLTGNYSNEKQKLELVRALELEDKEKQQSLKMLKNCLTQYLIKISKPIHFLKYVQELLRESSG